MGKIVDTDELIKNIANIEDLRKLSTKTIGEAIDKTPAVDRWINTKNKMPEHNQRVLCLCHGNYYEVLKWDNSQQIWILDKSKGYFKAYVKCWMKLPEPPKGAKICQ